jgi:hypothetical protein
MRITFTPSLLSILVSPSASKGFAGWEPEKPSPHLDTMGLTLAPAPMLVWGAP